MKLSTTAVLTLFLNSVSAKKTGDDHMIRNLLAKVEAQDAKMAVYDAKIANLEALLLGAPRVPQGKKNLRRRGLREDDATADFAAILMDFATMTEEKTEDMIAHLGVTSVLKTLIFEMNPVINCLTYDNDSQTCTLGSDETNTVDIIAEEDIDVTAIEGGDIKIEAVEGDVDIFAGDAGGGGNITISALSANNDDDLGNVNIDADEGVDIDTDDVTINAEGVVIDAGRVDIETDDEVIIDADFVDIDAGAGGVDIDSSAGVTIDGSSVDIDTDDFTLNAGTGDITIETTGFVDIDSTRGGEVDIGAGIDLTAGKSSGTATNNGGDITIEAFAGSVNTALGGNVAVNTDGAGDFTVDGSTVVP